MEIRQYKSDISGEFFDPAEMGIVHIYKNDWGYYSDYDDGKLDLQCTPLELEELVLHSLDRSIYVNKQRDKVEYVHKWYCLFCWTDIYRSLLDEYRNVLTEWASMMTFSDYMGEMILEIPIHDDCGTHTLEVCPHCIEKYFSKYITYPDF